MNPMAYYRRRRILARLTGETTLDTFALAAAALGVLLVLAVLA